MYIVYVYIYITHDNNNNSICIYIWYHKQWQGFYIGYPKPATKTSKPWPRPAFPRPGPMPWPEAVPRIPWPPGPSRVAWGERWRTWPGHGITSEDQGMPVISNTKNMIYPLVMSNSYWKWPFIVDFPMKNVDLTLKIRIFEWKLIFQPRWLPGSNC